MLPATTSNIVQDSSNGCVVLSLFQIQQAEQQQTHISATCEHQTTNTTSPTCVKTNKLFTQPAPAPAPLAAAALPPHGRKNPVPTALPLFLRTRHRVYL
jgi:hypothetical protein